jgi:hypothetical protein
VVTRGSWGEKDAGERVGEVTQLHGQGLSEHPNGIGKCPSRRCQSRNPLSKEKERNAVHKERESARGGDTYLDKVCEGVENTESSYVQ